jgi:hypothetical protein
MSWPSPDPRPDSPGPWASSAAVSSPEPDTAETFQGARSPVWLLALGGALDLVGLILLLFWGLGGAVGAYVCALAAFACVLLFRRRDNVLRQTSWVAPWPGARLAVPVLMIATIVLMVAAVLPIATELSRGV